MAIYDLGTASLSANGEVTGTGTTWKAPLTLIRVGATIIFKTNPLKIYTISEIISDTQINVYNPNSETVPAGTGYAILAHDGITVQGLAQDVAETLRYYQSRETEVADAVDAFNNFDSADFESKVTRVNTQHGDVVSIGAQVANDAAQISSDKDSAAASAISASSDKDAAAASAQEAADYAALLDTENLLRKDLALSDLTDKTLARSNLDVYSKSQVFDGAFRVRGLRSYYGAAGDGVTDDTNKLKTAIDQLAAGSYDKLVIDSGEFLIAGGIIAEFGAISTAFKVIECIGKIRHTATSGDCIEIRNAFYCDFNFNFVGNGYDQATIPNYRLADPPGAKQGLIIAGCRACKIKLKSTGYEGRVFRTKMSGSVKPSFLDLDITTGNDTSGQAFYIQGTDAWGVIRHAQTNWEYWGSVVEAITDMTIVYWEAGVKNTVNGPAMELKSLTNCHIGTLAAGGNEVLINGGTGITIQKGLFGESLTTGSGNGYALRVVGNGFTDGNAKHQLTINNLVTGNSTTAGIYLDAVVGVTLKDVLIDGSDYGVVMSNLCRDVNISGECRNQNISAIHATETGNLDSVSFEKLNIYNAGSGTHGIDLSVAAGTNAVSIRDCRINVKGRYFRLKDSNAGVSVYGGRFLNSELGLSAERPRHISNVTGVNTRIISTQSFAASSPSGTTLTLNHGLVYTPTEVYVTVTDLSNNVSSGSNAVLVRSLDATSIVFKYSGGSALSNALSFRVTARCEDR